MTTSERPALDTVGGRPDGSDLAVDHHSDSPVGVFLVGAGMLAVSVVLLTQVFTISNSDLSPQGPRFLPLVVVSLWALLSLLYLLQQTIRLVRRTGGLPAERFTHMAGASLLVVMLVVYAYVLDPIGYLITTTLFFVGAARTMGSHNWARDILVAVLLTLGIYLAFTRALGVNLPIGVLPL